MEKSEMDLLTEIVAAFPLTAREARTLILTAPKRYKLHYIDKRHNRGKRLIAQPTAEIKVLQSWGADRYLAGLPVHEVATAYRKGKSIKAHAEPHARNHYLLKLDFKDFFPSIRGDDFFQHLRRHSGIDETNAQLLTSLFFRLDRDLGILVLSIGAPTSPMISNTLLFDFDSALFDFCHSKGVTYTRYADDIALSTNRPKVLDEVHSFVMQLCRQIPYPRLKLNPTKTVFTSKKRQRQLTGLVLSNDGTASLGRERKREIRALVHRLALSEQVDQAEVLKVRGLISYCLSIDPAFVASLRRMLGGAAFSRIMK